MSNALHRPATLLLGIVAVTFAVLALAACGDDDGDGPAGDPRVRAAVPFLGDLQNARLAVFDFPGGAETVLMEPFAAVDVTWSATGEYLAVTGWAPPGEPPGALARHILGGSGAEQAIFPAHGWVFPAWSPRGDLLAAVADELIIVTPTGDVVAEAEALPEMLELGGGGAGAPALAWSNAGDRVTVATVSALLILGVDGATRKVDLSATDVAEAMVLYPAWWANESEIVIAIQVRADRPEDAYRSYGVDPETGEVTERDVGYPRIVEEIPAAHGRVRADADVADILAGFNPPDGTGFRPVGFDGGRGAAQLFAADPQGPFTLAVAWHDIAEAIEITGGPLTTFDPMAAVGVFD